MMLATAFLLMAQDSPRIDRVSLAAADILCVEIRHGRVETPPSVAAPLPAGAKVPPWNDRYVTEGDREVGVRVGPKADRIQPHERVVGAAWDPGQVAGISVKVDSRNALILDRARKSGPTNVARIGGWKFAPAMRHRVYLRLPMPLAGKRVEVSVPGAGSTSLRMDTKVVRTEGLHVVQTGFRPDDPKKTAVFSLWLGEFGNVTPKGGVEILDTKNLQVVGRAPFALHHDGAKPDTQTGSFGMKAPAYVVDFSFLKKPGTYRLHVPGVGCSYDFEISSDIWENIFTTATKGFYFQRNGIAHGSPFGTYRSKRTFHPADGIKVFASTTSLMDSGNGLNALGTDKDNFGNLVKGATTQVIPNTWGGYKDAGDWDSRIQHLEATRQLLELAELFPEPIKTLRLNIPETGKGLPDVVAEAKWNIDHYRRLQTAAGGIRGGVEQEEHPVWGEVSWISSLRTLTYAPDPWSSWLYAASASQLARVVRPTNAAMAREYVASATRAYDWGVAELRRLNRPKLPVEVRDAQNLAALWLYRETKQPRFAQDFRNTVIWNKPGAGVWEWQVGYQGESAALAMRSNILPDVTAAARAALIRQGEQSLAFVKSSSTRSAFINEFDFPGYGRTVNPRGTSFLIWAHQASGERKFLDAILDSASFGLGANPANVVFTSGVGKNPTRNPFMLDPRLTQQPFPAGITVYGPMVWVKGQEPDTWWKVVQPFVYPAPADWPTGECFWDAFWTISASEFTIMESMGPTSFTWGYLAFRK